MPPAHTEYRAALDALFARTGGTSRYGLERMRDLLAALGDPHERVPVFHVAGTNGKGSTVVTLVALLRAQGLRVAAYTSPHLVDFRERIVVDGRAIAPGAVVDFLSRTRTLSERLGATFFEVTTALAFAHFADAGAEVAVIETGLGGRLDATNVVTPVVAGVTEIGLDHTELLGDTVAAIAAEKAGIYKRGVPAVVGASGVEARAVLTERACAVGAHPIRVVAEECTIRDVRVSAAGTRFMLGTGRGTRSLTVPLRGAFQAANVATALTMLDAAGPAYAMAPDRLAGALGDVWLPGRAQRVGRYLFDVAHNPDGARGLRATLDALTSDTPGLARPVVALIGVLSDKDWRGVIDALAPAVDEFVLTTPPTAPAGRVWDLDAAERYAASRGYVAVAVHDFDDALAHAGARGATTVVTGSFHTVGDAMLRLQVDPLAA